MKILHTVEYYNPSAGGAQEVVKQISEGLAAKGHEVTVATKKLPERTSRTINRVKIQEFDISGNEVRGYSGETSRYQDFLRDSRFDIMMNYAAQQWASDLVFPLLKSLPYRKVFIPCGFSALFAPQYQDYFQKMPSILRDYDQNIFHTNIYRDIEFAKQHGVTNYSVIPNGASELEFTSPNIDFRGKYGIRADIPMLLTVGDHTGLKGHSLAMKAFLRARIGRSVLVILGGLKDEGGCVSDCRKKATLVNLVTLGRKQVMLLDVPRTDAVAAFKAADLFVFGSNIEYSPLVLFEAMASKTPFITSACGNAEEIVSWSKGGVVMPTDKLNNGYVTARTIDLARAIEDLLRDDAKRQTMAASGFQAWTQNFTWEKIITRYEQVYEQALGA